MKPVRLPDHPLNILHLGDSYTIGEGVDLEDGWPFQLHELMIASGFSIALAEIIARTAWTTTDLLEAMDNMDLQPEWDLITLCIGVNNQYQGLDQAAFGRELTQLVEMALALRASKSSCFILLSIPDWSVAPFAADRDPGAIVSAIDAFNSVVASVANQTSVPFIDWTPLTREATGQEDAFTDDGLHPSRKEYARWAAYLAKQI
jgi:lysophospholipase L1-like esterase